jgi:predicted NBD/HSP70 family sugar kinase
MNFRELNISPKVVPELDKDFCPAVLVNRSFLEEINKANDGTRIVIAIERGSGLTSVYESRIFKDDCGKNELNFIITERIIKTLLWLKGGWKVTIAGSKIVGEAIKKAYSPGGIREFDANFMGRVYEKTFTVEVCEYENIPPQREDSKPVGRHLDGCRIGFDAGGSDRKVSAVIDGETVYSEEVVWYPKINSDPNYHYEGIVAAMKTAAAHMPRVDAIGVSSAGIYINNRVMVASLFLKVPEEIYDKKVKDIYLNAAKEIGEVPVEVANDGDVTALAGAMDLEDTNVLGIAMGTSEAAGYVDSDGNITGWLNELAFVPVDFNENSMVDEWSGDYGCGVKYFSQDAVIKLAPCAGIELDPKLSPGDKLKIVQGLLDKGNTEAMRIFETIGCYLGYGIAYYAQFYDIKHILVLGRVTSGEGGNIILKIAKKVLEMEFPELSKKINITLPDETNRRVGQSIAAASLPKIK